jgi:2-C-methyl-D-erythritol 4-phosphate cytidylyltransferase
MNVVALIMAGGSGDRFGAGTPKQFASLRGRPMIAWSAGLFAASPDVAGLVVVGPAGDEDALRAALTPDARVSLRTFVAGGATRQESVFNGLQAVPAGTTHVLIHDAARPCATPALRDRVLDALKQHDAVIPVVPATDTLVRMRGRRVEGIVERRDIAAVQTPQGFRIDLILRAHREAKTAGRESSDDGSLVLALGEPVATIEGERGNIKVTYRDDVAMAEAILQGVFA